MMMWNYRVFRENDSEYVIREVFYNDDGTIIACTADPIEPAGESLEELARTLEDFQAALKLPVLTNADIPDTQADGSASVRGKQPTIRHEDIRATLGLPDSSSATDRPSRSRRKTA